jgi:hypothetical protein
VRSSGAEEFRVPSRMKPAVVRLQESALPPIEVLHGIRKVAPDHVVLLPP